jgi:hypothetical protein
VRLTASRTADRELALDMPQALVKNAPQVDLGFRQARKLSRISVGTSTRTQKSAIRAAFSYIASTIIVLIYATPCAGTILTAMA